MDKVTYEEESINIWGHKFTKEEFDNLVVGLKPPTFDEVVKAWEKVNKDLNVYIHNNEFCVTDIDEEETSVFWYDIKTGGYEFECVSMEMIYAINLTIRYLEAKA